MPLSSVHSLIRAVGGGCYAFYPLLSLYFVSVCTHCSQPPARVWYCLVFSQQRSFCDDSCRWIDDGVGVALPPFGDTSRFLFLLLLLLHVLASVHLAGRGIRRRQIVFCLGIKRRSFGVRLSGVVPTVSGRSGEIRRLRFRLFWCQRQSQQLVDQRPLRQKDSRLCLWISINAPCDRKTLDFVRQFSWTDRDLTRFDLCTWKDVPRSTGLIREMGYFPEWIASCYWFLISYRTMMWMATISCHKYHFLRKKDECHWNFHVISYSK